MNNDTKTKKRRRGAIDSLQHVYKRSIDRGVIFYRREDHLVYYTLQSVLSRRHRIRVVCTSHMFTHIHEGLLPEDMLQLSAYQHDLSSIFAREYNRECGRTGALFGGRFGSAPKRSEKEKRACMIYILNNPVEKKLVARAVEDRWNFLAYYENDYPFSKRPIIRYSRKKLVDSMHLVEHEYRAGRYLKYELLHYIFAGLSNEEKEQLTDYIIHLYYFFDREVIETLFGGVQKMIAATDLTTGKEFDVGEEFDPLSDVPYREMCSLVSRHGLLGTGLPFLHFPKERQERLSRYLQQQTGATQRQIARFLHWAEE